MAIIYSYPLNDNIKPLDELVGTTEKNINGQLKTVTRNFLLEDLAEFFIVDGGLQREIILTTNGTSGASTLDQLTGVLNIPQYSGATDLSYIASALNGIVTSSTGLDATIPLANSTNAGLLNPAGFIILGNTSGTNTGDQNLQSVTNMGSVTTNSITANSFIKSGGTGANILLDNGSTVALSSVGGDTNLSTSQTATNFTINSDTGTDASVPLGNGTLAGATLNNYTTAEKNKLGAISGTNTGDQNLQSVTNLGATTTNPITINTNSNNGLVVTSLIFGVSAAGHIAVNASGIDCGVSASAIDTGVEGYGNNKGLVGYGENIGIEAYSGAGKGLFVNGNGTVAIEANLGNSNKGLVISSGTSSTGNFIQLDKNGVDKLVVNQAGELTAQKLIKQGGTPTQFLMGDGSVTIGNGGVYSYEIHVSQVDGNDTTGTGALLNPVATITKALTLITGLRRTIVIHPGSYTENPSITTQYTVLTTYGVIGGNTLLTGTLTTSTGCSITGLKMTNLTITAPTGTGNVNILNCDITGTLIKNSTADYTLIRFCDVGTINITGSNLVAIFGGNPNFITVNNAAARVIVKTAVTVAPVLTAGSLSIVDSIVVAAVTNAFTSAAGTFTTLANSQFLISALNNVAPVVLNGFYSILNCVFDKPNSTLVALSGTGGTTNSIVYSQFVNADKFIKQGGTPAQILAADGSVITAGNNITITGGQISSTGGGGSVSLSAIGSVPNANAATLTGSVLNLQPASDSFGGVITTGTQTFAGAKTFTGAITASNLSGTNTGNQSVNTLTNVSINTEALFNGDVLQYESPTSLWKNNQILIGDSDYGNDNNTYNSTLLASTFATFNDLSFKQNILQNTVNIKSINGNSLLGSGNLTVTASAASQGAFTILANNTGSSAIPTEQVYKEVAQQPLSGTGMIATGGTLPTGTNTHFYRWSQVGNLVTVRINLQFGTAGTCSGIAIPFANMADIPQIPQHPSIYATALDVITYGSGNLTPVKSFPTFATGVGTSAIRIKTLGTPNTYEFLVGRVSGSYNNGWIQIQYYI